MSRQLTRWCAAVVLVFALAGAACGWLWEWVWDAPTGVVVKGAWYPDPWDAGNRAAFSGTGWYVAIALTAGLLLGLGAGLRSRGRELATLAAVLVGSALAGALMYAVGVWLAPADPEPMAAGLADGQRLRGSLSVSGATSYAAFTVGALLPLAVLYLTVTRRPAEPRTAEPTRR
ncbi:MAG TPA: hypothetical protein VGE38_11165 [Nocardioides sp.]|uniref:hypothetical protein n=1 Tax=Nocardioides sp. TaxID=35761 RepID=UPI002EDA2185